MSSRSRSQQQSRAVLPEVDVSRSQRETLRAIREPTRVDIIRNAIPPSVNVLPPNPLPTWERYPLEKKFPVVPTPNEKFAYARNALGEDIFVSTPDLKFDNEDPLVQATPSGYTSLHDSNLKLYFDEHPKVFEALVDKGLVDPADGGVKADMRDYNKYRSYLARLRNTTISNDLRFQDQLGKAQISQGFRIKRHDKSLAREAKSEAIKARLKAFRKQKLAGELSAQMKEVERSTEYIEKKEREHAEKIVEREMLREKVRERLSKLRRAERRRARQIILEWYCKQLYADMLRKALGEHKKASRQANLESFIDSKREFQKTRMNYESNLREKRAAERECGVNRRRQYFDDIEEHRPEQCRMHALHNEMKARRELYLMRKFGMRWLNIVRHQMEYKNTYHDSVWRVRQKLIEMVREMQDESGRVTFTNFIQGLVALKPGREPAPEMSEETKEIMNYILDLLIQAALDTFKQHHRPCSRAYENQENRRRILGKKNLTPEDFMEPPPHHRNIPNIPFNKPSHPCRQETNDGGEIGEFGECGPESDDTDEAEEEGGAMDGAEKVEGAPSTSVQSKGPDVSTSERAVSLGGPYGASNDEKERTLLSKPIEEAKQAATKTGTGVKRSAPSTSVQSKGSDASTLERAVSPGGPDGAIDDEKERTLLSKPIEEAKQAATKTGAAVKRSAPSTSVQFKGPDASALERAVSLEAPEGPSDAEKERTLLSKQIEEAKQAATKTGAAVKRSAPSTSVQAKGPDASALERADSLGGPDGASNAEKERTLLSKQIEEAKQAATKTGAGVKRSAPSTSVQAKGPDAFPLERAVSLGGPEGPSNAEKERTLSKQIEEAKKSATKTGAGSTTCLDDAEECAPSTSVQYEGLDVSTSERAVSLGGPDGVSNDEKERTLLSKPIEEAKQAATKTGTGVKRSAPSTSVQSKGSDASALERAVSPGGPYGASNDEKERTLLSKPIEEAKQAATKTGAGVKRSAPTTSVQSKGPDASPLERAVSLGGPYGASNDEKERTLLSKPIEEAKHAATKTGAAVKRSAPSTSVQSKGPDASALERADSLGRPDGVSNAEKERTLLSKQIEEAKQAATKTSAGVKRSAPSTSVQSKGPDASALERVDSLGGPDGASNAEKERTLLSKQIEEAKQAATKTGAGVKRSAPSTSVQSKGPDASALERVVSLEGPDGAIDAEKERTLLSKQNEEAKQAATRTGAGSSTSLDNVEECAPSTSVQSEGLDASALEPAVSLEGREGAIDVEKERILLSKQIEEAKQAATRAGAGSTACLDDAEECASSTSVQSEGLVVSALERAVSLEGPDGAIDAEKERTLLSKQIEESKKAATRTGAGSTTSLDDAEECASSTSVQSEDLVVSALERAVSLEGPDGAIDAEKERTLLSKQIEESKKAATRTGAGSTACLDDAEECASSTSVQSEGLVVSALERAVSLEGPDGAIDAEKERTLLRKQIEESKKVATRTGAGSTACLDDAEECASSTSVESEGLVVSALERAVKSLECPDGASDAEKERTLLSKQIEESKKAATRTGAGSTACLDDAEECASSTSVESEGLVVSALERAVKSLECPDGASDPGKERTLLSKQIEEAKQVATRTGAGSTTCLDDAEECASSTSVESDGLVGTALENAIKSLECPEAGDSFKPGGSPPPSGRGIVGDLEDCENLIQEMARAAVTTVLPVGSVTSEFFQDLNVEDMLRDPVFPFGGRSDGPAADQIDHSREPRRMPTNMRDNVLHTLSNVQHQLDAIRHELQQYGVIPSDQQGNSRQ